MTKNELRLYFAKKRKEIKNKEELDAEILHNLLKCSEFKNAGTVLCYASMKDEITTDGIIAGALSDGKRVALPVCTDSLGNMEFYLINGIDELKEGFFSVREPDVSKHELLTDFTDAAAVVPGLCFNREGARLGYGKGYYDRFLKNHSLFSIGLCYNTFIIDNLTVCDYDIPVNAIVTENGIIYCDNGGKNG